MSFASIIAFLSLLTAFNVPQPTIDQIRGILIPVEASTTPVTLVQVIQTPIQENQPVYFGSTAIQVSSPPVNNSPQIQTPVVVLPVMDSPRIQVRQTMLITDEAQQLPMGTTILFTSDKELDFSQTTFSDGITFDSLLSQTDVGVPSEKYSNRIKISGLPSPFHPFTMTVKSTEGGEASVTIYGPIYKNGINTNEP